MNDLESEDDVLLVLLNRLGAAEHQRRQQVDPPALQKTLTNELGSHSRRYGKSRRSEGQEGCLDSHHLDSQEVCRERIVSQKRIRKDALPTPPKTLILILGSPI